MSTLYNLLLLFIVICAYYFRLKLLKKVYNCKTNDNNNNEHDTCFMHFMTFNNIVSLMIIGIPFLIFSEMKNVFIAIPVLLLLNSQLLFLEIQYFNWEK